MGVDHQGRSKEFTSNIFSRLHFLWIGDLIKLGYERPLEQPDLPELDSEDMPQAVLERFREHWKPGQTSLVGALIKTFLWPWVRSVLTYGVAACSLFAGPLLLQVLIEWLERGAVGNEGITYALLLLFVPIIGTYCNFQSQQMVWRIGSQARTLIITLIYSKSFRLTTEAQRVHGPGEVVTLLSNDSQRLRELAQWLNLGMFAPVQLVVALVLLINLVGWYGFVAFGILVLSGPLNAIVVKRFIGLRRESLKQTGKRTSLINEVLLSIQVIKFYAWEASFSQLLSDRRRLEMEAIFKSMTQRGLLITVIVGTPLIMTVAMFASLVADTGSMPPASTAFAALAMLAILRVPMAMLPIVLAILAQTRVSLKRIEQFLVLDEEPGQDERDAQQLRNETELRELVTGDGKQVAAAFCGAYVSWGRSAKELQEGAEAETQAQEAEEANHVMEAVPGVELLEVTEIHSDALEEWHGSEEDNESVASDEEENEVDATPLNAITVQLEPGKEGQDSAQGEEGDEQGQQGERGVTNTLRDVSVLIKAGDLTSVIGKVGSGKSSLLAALTGTMMVQRGKVLLRGTVSLAAQQPFILNGTVRDNILFFSSFDEERYNTVIQACSLLPDLEMMAKGDRTMIGERGITLSGGQKARIALARCVYREADIYMLDDPLSAVDSHVGAHIFEQVVCKLLAGKTRVLVTNQLDYLARSDHIVMMHGGCVAEQGTFDELNNSGREFSQLMDEFQVHQREATEVTEQAELDVDAGSGSSGGAAALGAGVGKVDRPLDKAKSSEGGDDELMTEEERKAGRIPWSIYLLYFTPKSRRWLGVAFLLMMLVDIVTRIGADWWLSRMTEDAFGWTDEVYLVVYGVITVVACALIYARSLVHAVFSYTSSMVLHEGMLAQVLAAPMAFFDTTPQGRIINRFSKDLDEIDQLLPQSILPFIATMMQITVLLIILCTLSPLLLIVVAILMAFFYHLQKYFRATSLELQRLESISNSPLIAHVSESLNGQHAIRTFGLVPQFLEKNIAHQVENLKAFWALRSATHWYGFRLEAIGTTIEGVLAVLIAVNPRAISPSLAALSLTYGMQLGLMLNRFGSEITKVERHFNSVERVATYSDTEVVPVERHTVGDIPDEEWPNRGAIEFDHVSLRYRPGLDLALRDANFRVEAGERIGVVGRTGAGKSTLLAALFRTVELEDGHGHIRVDGVDLAQLKLGAFRCRIGIIPQSPVVFSGTVRSNLDPFGTVDDDEVLWTALQQAQLDETVREMEGGLDADIDEGGANLSVGQRQLVCLARALLRKPSVLVLDEATASVDRKTDEVIQEAIREHFGHATIISIAHRLATIIDYDRILVMDAGQVAEYASPRELLSDPGSLFSGLVDASGEESAAYLRRVALGEMDSVGEQSKKDR